MFRPELSARNKNIVAGTLSYSIGFIQVANLIQTEAYNKWNNIGLYLAAKTRYGTA